MDAKDSKEALKAAVRLRKQQLNEALKAVPPRVVNGGIERAKAYKAWASKATKAASAKGSPTVQQLDTLLGEYRALCAEVWYPGKPSI